MRRQQRSQFRLAQLMLAVAVVAILIQPTVLLVTTIADHFGTDSTITLSVPDGGTVIIGGMIFRPNGTRQTLTLGTASTSRDTPPIVIQEPNSSN